MPASRRWAAGVAAAGSAVLLGGGLAAFSPATAAPSPTTFASPTATSVGAGTSCATAKFTTISAAVASAAPKATVVACPGTYTEHLVIQKPLRLVGMSATINAAGLPGASIGSILGQQPYAGVTIEASHVTVKGLTVENAEGEGIVAVNPNPVAGPILGGNQFHTGKPLRDITIVDNVVQNNNVGFNNPASPYSSCTPNGGSDCGGGIHLLSVADSTVLDNTVTGNADGILLTDEFGPNHDNLVKRNYVEGNTRECGIVLPGHNLALNPTTGKLNPSFAGVYRNRVIDNIVIANGVAGYGSGIGVFAPATGTGSYDNVVSRNFIEGNGLAGISVHSHQANAYVNGNVFTDNTIGTNNVDLADGTDNPAIGSKQTTGILIWSVTKYHVVVAHNKIFANAIGIWYTPSTISISGLHSNHYFGVTTPVFLAP